MYKISDSELLDELRRRFIENKKAVHDLQILTKKLEKMNAKLIESEALKSNFISNIKNELNNPITSVLIMTNELVANIDKVDAQLRNILESLYFELLTINYNLRNIFMAAEIESGELRLDIAKINLKQFIKNTLNEVDFLLKRKNIVLELQWLNNEIDEDNYFKIDSEKLQLLLINLLWNSIEYSLNNSKIIFTISLKDGILNFWIRDFGFQMSSDDIDTIFGEFRHISVDLTKKDRGRSLSLNVSKSLIELMSGSIDVTPNENSKGCTFNIAIPESKMEVEETISDDGNEFFF